jgi:acyl-CoA synthetase (AMP-forming)/AMP-acid ligase II
MEHLELLACPFQTLPGVVLSRSRSVGSRTCAQCWDEEHGVTSTCTFSEFASDMLRAGSWLQSYGLKEHDFCAILAQNSLRYLCVSFGAMSLGAISMNLNWQQPIETTCCLLERHRVRVLCTCAHFQPIWQSTKTPIGALAGWLGIDEFQHLLLDDQMTHDLTDCRKAQVLQSLNRVSASATAAVFFTSGTTGVPKAVPHTHMGLAWHATKSFQFVSRHVRSLSQGTVCFTPFFHVMGFVANCVFNLHAGVPINVQSAPLTQVLTPELMVAACKSLGPSMVNTVPWIMAGLAEMVSSSNADTKAVVSQPDVMSYGGAAFPVACADLLRSSGAKIMCTYGQTELGGPVLFGTPGGDPNALIPWVDYDLERSPHDAEDEGELVLIDNCSTTAGYLTDTCGSTGCYPRRFNTHDRFRRTVVDGRQHLVYVCRNDDLIKHATGEFTNPLVTEHELLNACVGIVHAACMVGNSQPRAWLLLELCEQVSAMVAHQLNDAIKLANAKQPKYSAVLAQNVLLLTIDALPRTAKGTIKRHQAEALIDDASQQQTLAGAMKEVGGQNDAPRIGERTKESCKVVAAFEAIFPAAHITSASSFDSLGGTSYELVQLTRHLSEVSGTTSAELKRLDTVSKIQAFVLSAEAAAAKAPVPALDLDAFRPFVWGEPENAKRTWYLSGTVPIPAAPVGHRRTGCSPSVLFYRRRSGRKQHRLHLERRAFHAVAKLMELHPPLRMRYTSRGHVDFPWMAHQVKVTIPAGGRFAECLTPEVFVDTPLFKWAVQDDEQLIFFVHHVISDAESVANICRDLTALLKDEMPPPRPYHLLQSVAELLAECKPEVYQPSAVDGRTSKWNARWQAANIPSSCDVLASVVHALVQANCATLEADVSAVSVIKDVRFLPFMRHPISSLVSYLLVEMECQFNATFGVEQVRRAIDESRRVVGGCTTAVDAKANATPTGLLKVNYVIQEDETPSDFTSYVPSETDGRMMRQRHIPPDMIDNLNIRFFPRANACILYFEGVDAAGREWFSIFESTLLQNLYNGAMPYSMPDVVAGEVPLQWDPHADCDGFSAGGRAAWLVKNEGISENDARQRVMSDYDVTVGTGEYECHVWDKLQA